MQGRGQVRKSLQQYSPKSPRVAPQSQAEMEPWPEPGSDLDFGLPASRMTVKFCSQSVASCPGSHRKLTQVTRSRE
jgi:hypothetical protein